MKVTNSKSIAIQLKVFRIFNMGSIELFDKASRTGAEKPLSYSLCEAKPCKQGYLNKINLYSFIINI